jgi:cephalosporin-C deacetylase-like acetyl esterase
MEYQKIHGDLCHETLRDNLKQKLAFDENKDLSTQRQLAKQKFLELIGYDKILNNKALDDEFTIEETEELDGYTKIRFTFKSEIDSTVPCYLLIPGTGKDKYPLAITMQGHSSGFHNSIGIAKSEHDEEYIKRGDFAVQAVKEGFAALAIEQRCMGERMTTRHAWGHMCEFPSLNAIMLGRTTVGERIFDISCAIDKMANFDKVDTDKILITGNSGGGTISYYASCVEDRIKFAIPSCAFCSFKTSIMDIWHCACNYIPDIYEWFEMHDVAVLLAPKKVTFVAGKEDAIFPIAGVRDSFSVVEKIYEKAGAPDMCKLVETPKGHWWCQDIVWDEARKGVKELGW